MICALHRTVTRSPCAECLVRFRSSPPPQWSSWQQVYLHRILRYSALGEAFLRVHVVRRNKPQSAYFYDRRPQAEIPEQERCISGLTVFHPKADPRCVFWTWPTLSLEEQAATVFHEAAHALSGVLDHGAKFRSTLLALAYREQVPGLYELQSETRGKVLTPHVEALIRPHATAEQPWVRWRPEAA